MNTWIRQKQKQAISATNQRNLCVSRVRTLRSQKILKLFNPTPIIVQHQ